jgi:hypothetical protein
VLPERDTDAILERLASAVANADAVLRRVEAGLAADRRNRVSASLEPEVDHLDDDDERP